MTMFSINVSSYNYNENQLCVGEVLIKSNLDVSITISNNKSFSARDAVRLPDFNMITNIYDKQLKNIEGLNYVIDYIFSHNLFDVIVEFSSFDIKVGLNKENVIIYELRTDY